MSAVFVGKAFFVFSLVALSATIACAQQSPAVPEPAFEAASIRPSHLTPGCFSSLPPGGTQYALTCVPLLNLIGIAWEMSASDIEGGDSGALSTYYDLRAVAPGGLPWTSQSIPPMLRRLLTDRFRIVAHRGTKQVSGYILVVAKGGPKLHPSGSDGTHEGQKAGEPSQSFIFPGYIHSPGANMAVVAGMLTLAAHATVTDRSGLEGAYELDLHFAAENSSDSEFPDLFTAVQEQLGLKLQPGKVTVETLVIDHVDGAPTAN